MTETFESRAVKFSVTFCLELLVLSHNISLENSYTKPGPQKFFKRPRKNSKSLGNGKTDPTLNRIEFQLNNGDSLEILFSNSKSDSQDEHIVLQAHWPSKTIFSYPTSNLNLHKIIALTEYNLVFFRQSTLKENKLTQLNKLLKYSFSKSENKLLTLYLFLKHSYLSLPISCPLPTPTTYQKVALLSLFKPSLRYSNIFFKLQTISLAYILVNTILLYLSQSIGIEVL
jgi:hypothetical protein